MEQSSCLLLPTLVLAILSPGLCLPGEKFRINPDDIERVKQMSNMTDGRDRTAKNVNFAWKQTIQSTVVVMTTQDPKYTSTLDPEMQKKNNEIYDKLFAQLAYTLRDKEYLNRWLTEMDKGYHIFLYEIQKQDRSKFFKKFYGKDLFDREDGSRLFVVMMTVLENLMSKENFIEFEKNLYKNQYGKDLGPEHFNDIKQPTDSMEAKNETSAAFNVMHLFMLKSLGEPSFRGRWVEAKSKGYDNLIKELEDKGPDHFINKDKDDENFMAGKGGLFWHGVIKYLKSIGEKGFDALCNKVDNLPKTITSDEVVKKRLLWL